MYDFTWNERFTTLFNRCLAEFDRGNSNFNSYYSEDDLSFLRAIGYKPRELFDFVEDCGADLPASTALLVAAVRRAYFARVQGNRASKLELTPEDLPAKDATMGGIPWLPRILAKARAKLKGELNPDIMYGCGGDRAFLAKYDIPPADFLEVVWQAGEDDTQVLDYVRARKTNAP